MSEFELEEPAIVSANDAPTETVIVEDKELVLPSRQPYVNYAYFSAFMALEGYLEWNYLVKDSTNGTDYKWLYYSKLATFVPILLSSAIVALLPSPNAWTLLRFFLEMTNVNIYFENWASIAYAQYKRTDSLSSSNNVKALGLSLAYSVAVWFVVNELNAAVDQNDQEYKQAVCDYDSESQVCADAKN